MKSTEINFLINLYGFSRNAKVMEIENSDQNYFLFKEISLEFLFLKTPPLSQGKPTEKIQNKANFLINLLKFS